MRGHIFRSLSGLSPSLTHLEVWGLLPVDGMHALALELLPRLDAFSMEAGRWAQPRYVCMKRVYEAIVL